MRNAALLYRSDSVPDGIRWHQMASDGQVEDASHTQTASDGQVEDSSHTQTASDGQVEDSSHTQTASDGQVEDSSCSCHNVVMPVFPPVYAERKRRAMPCEKKEEKGSFP